MPPGALDNIQPEEWVAPPNNGGITPRFWRLRSERVVELRAFDGWSFLLCRTLTRTVPLQEAPSVLAAVSARKCDS